MVRKQVVLKKKGKLGERKKKIHGPEKCEMFRLS